MPAFVPAAIFDAILKDVMAGEPVRRAIIARGSDNWNFYQFLCANSVAAERYARAREQGYDAMADDIIAIAESDIPPDQARLMIDARKWILAKRHPTKYGDTAQVKLSGTIEVIEVASEQARQMAEAMIESARGQSPDLRPALAHRVYDCVPERLSGSETPLPDSDGT